MNDCDIVAIKNAQCLYTMDNNTMNRNKIMELIRQTIHMDAILLNEKSWMIKVLHWHDINLWTVFTSQNDALQTGWKNAFTPLTSSWKWLWRRNNHQNVIITLDNSHYTNSATFFYIPEQTCQRGKIKLSTTWTKNLIYTFTNNSTVGGSGRIKIWLTM